MDDCFVAVEGLGLLCPKHEAWLYFEQFTGDTVRDEWEEFNNLPPHSSYEEWKFAVIAEEY